MASFIRFMAMAKALRTSLYVDDAAIFVAPFNDDIRNLTSILHDFGEVTRLCANCQKSFVVSIRCVEIDLDGALHGLLVEGVPFMAFWWRGSPSC
jgi:hypothetical protein